MLETPLWHDSSSCHYELPGYNLLFSSKKRNQNYGIFLFVKQCLNAKLFDFNLLEYNIVKLSFHNNNVPFTIICVCRLSFFDYIGFVELLRDILNSLNLNTGVITLIGDVNINIIGTQTYNYDYLDLLFKLGFRSLINIYTRLPQGLSSL